MSVDGGSRLREGFYACNPTNERAYVMKLSARNQLPGTVVEVCEGAVNGIVKIEVAPGLVISSSITNAAIEELGLTVGSKAVAVIKASNVIVGVED